MIAGIVTPRMEKNTEPTSDMKGSRFGIRHATATERNRNCLKFKILSKAAANVKNYDRRTE